MSFDFTSTCEELLSLPQLNSSNLLFDVLKALTDAHSAAEILDFIEFLLGRAGELCSRCRAEMESVRARIDTCASKQERRELLAILGLALDAHRETILLNYCIETLCELSIGQRVVGFTESFMRELKEAESAQGDEIELLISACDNIDI